MDDLFEYLEEDEEYIEAETEEDKRSLVGACHKCFNTSFVVEERNGVLGVVFTSTSNDSMGKPIRQLQVCGHGLKLNY